MQTYNKRKAIASFLVANRGVALYEPGTNTHLNGSGGAIVLADGQIGVFAESGPLMNKSLIAADTALKANEIALYQGTSASANPSQPQYPSPLFTRPYEKTQTINSRFPITVTKQPYTIGSLSTYTIKNITAVPFSNYALNIAFRGRNAQVMGSSQEAIAINPQFNTPAYTAGQLATAAPVSEIVNNMVVATLRMSSAINQGLTRQGNYPILALAIDTTAAATGVVISTLAAGTVLPILSDAYGIKSIILNAEQAASIIAAATASGIATSSKVVAANITTPVLSDAILLMGLDRVPAFKDYEWMVKTRIEVGITSGFSLSTTTLKQSTFAREEQGSARSLNNLYLFTQGQRKYNLLDVTDPVVNFPSPFTDLTETYNVFCISHEYEFLVDTSNRLLQGFVEYICFPTPVKGTPAVTGAFTALETKLNNYLASAGYESVD